MTAQIMDTATVTGTAMPLSAGTAVAGDRVWVITESAVASPTNPTGMSGCGATWTKVYDGARASVWRGDTPGTIGTVTMSGGSSAIGAAWWIRGASATVVVSEQSGLGSITLTMDAVTASSTQVVLALGRNVTVLPATGTLPSTGAYTSGSGTGRKWAERVPTTTESHQVVATGTTVGTQYVAAQIVIGDPPPAVTAAFTGSGTLSASLVPIATVTAAFTGSGTLSASVVAFPTPERAAAFTGSGRLTAPVAMIGALGANQHEDPQGVIGDGNDHGWYFGTQTASLPSPAPAGLTNGLYVDHDGTPSPSAGRGFIAYGPAMLPNRPIRVGAWVRAVSDTGWSGRVEATLSMVTDTEDWVDYDQYGPTIIVQDTEGWQYVEWILASPEATHLYPHVQFTARLTDDTAGPGGGKVRLYATGMSITQYGIAADFTGTGVLSATVSGTPEVIAAFSGAGALAAPISAVHIEAADFSGTGVLSAPVVAVLFRQADFSGSGDLSATVDESISVDAPFSGSGSLGASVVAVPISTVAAGLTGVGTLSAVAVVVGAPSPGTTRWVLRDTVTDAEWTMPINPDSMSSPLPLRQLKFARGWRKDARVRTFQGPSEAIEWEWAGVIRSKDHYDRLVEWAEKSVAVEVTDHLGRTFRIFISEFNPVDRRPTPRTPWRLRYTMKARVLERVG